VVVVATVVDVEVADKDNSYENELFCCYISLLLPSSCFFLLPFFFFQNHWCSYWLRSPIIITTDLSDNNTSIRTVPKRLTMCKKQSKINDCHRVVILICIQTLLGLPWIFQYVAMFSPHLVLSHYLFTIAIGSQGIVLLLLFCYRCVYLAKK